MYKLILLRAVLWASRIGWIGIALLPSLDGLAGRYCLRHLAYAIGLG